jgi:hypothetical protein
VKPVWTNPHNVDLTQPFLYLIKIHTGRNEYRYIGKGSSKSRLNAYQRNIERALAGKTKRPMPPPGKPVRPGNLRYRHIHLVMAIAEREGWIVEHYPIENVLKAQLNNTEHTRIREYDCNLNNGNSWAVETFDQKATEFIGNDH